MLSLLFYFIAKLTWLDSIVWLSKLNDLLEKYKYMSYKLNFFLIYSIIYSSKYILYQRWSFSIRFGFYKKKVTKPNLKKKPNRNRFKPADFGSVRFFRTKLVQTGLALVSVRFFWFQAYKTETEPNHQFFQNFNRFLFTVRLFRLFFFPVFPVYSVFQFFYSPLHYILLTN